MSIVQQIIDEDEVNNQDTEEFADELLVQDITNKMSARLTEARDNGKHGWWDPRVCSREHLLKQVDALDNETTPVPTEAWVDLIIYVAMIGSREVYETEQEEKS